MNVLDVPADDVLDALADVAENDPRAGRHLDLALEEFEREGDLSVITRLGCYRVLPGGGIAPLAARARSSHRPLAAKEKR